MKNKFVIWLILASLTLTAPAQLVQVKPSDVRKIERLQKRMERIKGKLAALGVQPEILTNTEYIEKIVIDSTMTDEARVFAQLLFTCDSAGNISISRIDSLTTELMNAKLNFHDNTLTVDATVPASVIRVPRLMTSLKNTVVQQKVTNILTSWQTFFIRSGQIMWGVFILVIIFVAIKELRRFL